VKKQLTLIVIVITRLSDICRLLFLKAAFQKPQVFLIGPSHGAGHERRQEFRESGGITFVAERHARRIGVHGVEQIDRFHRKRPIGVRIPFQKPRRKRGSNLLIL
jgi:hypothetical protein